MTMIRVAPASALRLFLLALGLLVLVVAQATPAAATLDPPQQSGNCASTNTSYVGISIGVGLGKDRTGAITKHNEALGLACLVRSAHHVRIMLQWDTVGRLFQGTFGGYIRDCTTKKWYLVTYLAYDNGTSHRRGAKTSTRSFTSRHKIQPVVQGDGAYSRAPFPIGSAASGHFASLKGFRAIGACV
ncbi:hypothetical protein [uncultured Jatrophihabitans sp.]|uniref:hypothetical protein n=1 Tax=uncultured Jatrophihabitans sp. TaxID=1610747 RepID=UPI0035C9E4B4